MRRIISLWLLTLAISSWLWFRAGRSYGRNEMIDAMVLRVQPPPAPYMDVAFLFGEVPQGKGILDGGSKIHFAFSSADGWTLKNIMVDEATKTINGCPQKEKQ